MSVHHLPIRGPDPHRHLQSSCWDGLPRPDCKLLKDTGSQGEGEWSLQSSEALRVAVPTQLQQRKDPAQKGGRLGGNLGAPAKQTSHDHQQNQAGQKKGKDHPWGERGCRQGQRRLGPPAASHASCLTAIAWMYEQASPGPCTSAFQMTGTVGMRRGATAQANGIVRDKPCRWTQALHWDHQPAVQNPVAPNGFLAAEH